MHARILDAPVQVRLHAARPALSHRVRSAAVRVHVPEGDATAAAEPSAPPVLYYPLMACMAMCLSCLEELSLELGGLEYYSDEGEEACPSVLAPLAGLPHLARLSVSYPGGAGIEVFQAGLGGCIQLSQLTS